tara:strand:+ start:165 stop:1010 length:846 start_codon:yes stop_codon:yes gene_type:complete
MENSEEKILLDEFSILDVFKAFKKYFYFFYIFVPLGFILAFITSSLLTPLYSSDILVANNNDTEESSSSALGGLASLAGIQLPQSNNKSVSSLAMLNSRTFLKSFIKEYDLKPNLFPDQWLVEAKKWSDKEPSDIAAIGELKKILDIKKIEGGLVEIGVTSYDPKLSVSVANNIIFYFNNYMRKDAIEESEQLIKFLEKEVVNSSLSEIRNRIFGLIKENIAEKSLANVRQEFVYKIIDKAYESNSPSFPNKLQISFIGIFLGLFIAAFTSAFLYFYRNID